MLYVNGAHASNARRRSYVDVVNAANTRNVLMTYACVMLHVYTHVICMFHVYTATYCNTLQHTATHCNTHMHVSL